MPRISVVNFEQRFSKNPRGQRDRQCERRAARACTDGRIVNPVERIVEMRSVELAIYQSRGSREVKLST